MSIVFHPAAIFERLRTVLHEGEIDKRVQYMVEVMFAVRKDGFKDHPSVMAELDLVDEDDQFTHLLTLEDAVDPEDMLSAFILWILCLWIKMQVEVQTWLNFSSCQELFFPRIDSKVFQLVYKIWLYCDLQESYVVLRHTG
jgi:hypothetical protein